MRLRVAALLAAFLLLAAVNPQADASIIPTLVAVTPNGDGTFTYTYNTDLAEDQNAMNDGATPGALTPAGVGAPSTTFKDYFTIYDFSGFVAVSKRSGWRTSRRRLSVRRRFNDPCGRPTSSTHRVLTGDQISGAALGNSAPVDPRL